MVASSQHLVDECRIVAENCLYTAQAHFVLAVKAERQSRWLLIFPSIVAAISGILVAIGQPGWIGAFAAASGLVAGVASALGVDRKATIHKQAGNLMTALRHEARALCDTYWLELEHQQLFVEVRRINDKYNCLIQALEITDSASFEKARKRIKEGFFDPDFNRQKVGSQCQISQDSSNEHSA